ncbi:class I SAM-dependent methyltransferase [Magnetospira sp. QH-2]|uniref:class I SAM-dependent methyltransferase n=1 Tax=Magnetospira sp. (strain QH-2) TaxID=1288970 RepID=UPI0003E81A82|nr:class I SAM-dependent methyltransferase [Magnetospira sp. QH-2]CCQ73040.1 conserved protein of unknown function [methyltransferase domain] [Magnetospira sp. QH-2]
MTKDLKAGLPAELFTFFEAMPRQGPGSEAVTECLYERFSSLMPARPKSADMGCGTGAAGIVLAEQGASVVGIDIHEPFLEAFEAEAVVRGVDDQVETRLASLAESGLDDESLDLVWSEGAVFTVGFDIALAEFMRVLKPGGLAVISECSWFQKDVPDELRTFWAGNYAGMRSVGENIVAAEQAGWRFLHTERLSSKVWELEFNAPMARLVESYRKVSDPAMVALAEDTAREIVLFRRHHALYGYAFFVLMKP